MTNQEERRMVKVLLPKKPMSMEEALLQLEVLDKQFFAFKSLETGKMSIVYKRKMEITGIFWMKNSFHLKDNSKNQSL
ncbi:hypothetical protein HMPREF9466_01118 [Fusobacterium necrophorum subsp. funduliforme 1_1_36S]|nr:hypothetical protein HMPREF9466_01118 [Fusobacterium necrophorum subsp. funduliforme 1_1_36S]